MTIPRWLEKVWRKSERESQLVAASPDVVGAKATGLLLADAPLTSGAEDRFGRFGFAKALANQIGKTPTASGYVIAVVGPWGSGKTSTINMALENLESSTEFVIVHFNPWLFSGADHLVALFFQEIGSQLARSRIDRIKDVGLKAAGYGLRIGGLVASASPVAASSLEGLAEDARHAISKSKSLSDQRDSLVSSLEKLEQRIVVVIDDIDRLEEREVREIMRLVKLTGDFPRVVYLLAFDRETVEQALRRPDYLAKIVQAFYDLPPPGSALLTALLSERLNETVAPYITSFDQRGWNSRFNRIIRPLCRNGRDVSRYLNALPIALELNEDEVELGDLLALEAIRVFLPTAHALLPVSTKALTDPPSASDHDRQTVLDSLITAAGDEHDGLIRDAIRILFPSAASYVEDKA